MDLIAYIRAQVDDFSDFLKTCMTYSTFKEFNSL